MPFYENVFLARQDVSSQQANALAETFANIITEHQGQVTKTEYWGLRNLAYRIKKNRKAHYVMLNIDAAPEALAEMERSMRINEDVIRFQTIRVEELEDGPSIVMRSKAAREDRGRRDDGRERGRDEDSDDVESSPVSRGEDTKSRGDDE